MTYDLCIIGGGINGCGIARDASGRGLKVLLLEKDDLASHTSSASTKLIHGGLRYLELYEFRLVREALQEREKLLKIAPHLITPMRFILPHHKGLRPRWLLRLGLFLYDNLCFGMSLPRSKAVDLSVDKLLKSEFKNGFIYSDLWVDDARLVVSNAMSAREQGADIYTKTALLKATHEDNLWTITHEKGEAKAKAVINASGAFVDEVNKLCGIETSAKVRKVKGSHIIINRASDKAYIFQNDDGRVLFSIPYFAFTLLGTTDVDVTNKQGEPKISDEEIDYIIKEANIYYKEPINKNEIIATYSGIRPLFNDGASRAQEATRDYVLKMTGENYLSVYGGKITTYRRLAEHALEHFTSEPAWTSTKPLAGGDFPHGKEAFLQQFNALNKSDDSSFAYEKTRLAHHYGTEVYKIIKGVNTLKDFGEFYGAISQRELDYLIENEFSTSADDLKRRIDFETMMLLSDEDKRNINSYIANKLKLSA